MLRAALNQGDVRARTYLSVQEKFGSKLNHHLPDVSAHTALNGCFRWYKTPKNCVHLESVKNSIWSDLFFLFFFLPPKINILQKKWVKAADFTALDLKTKRGWEGFICKSTRLCEKPLSWEQSQPEEPLRAVTVTPNLSDAGHGGH